MTWTVIDHDNDNRIEADSRSEAEERKATAQEFGSDNVEIVPPATDNGQTAAQVVEVDAEAETIEVEATEQDLDERNVTDDPIQWLERNGNDFVDYVGQHNTPAINRKGFEVLSHFYNITVKEPEVMVGPHETDFEYCQVRATAITEDGRECSALGSAHVDRGDDPELLLEMADTRARKRALSIATGVGAVAVSELKNEVGQ